MSPIQKRIGCNRGHHTWYPRNFVSQSAGFLAPFNEEELNRTAGNCFLNVVVGHSMLMLGQLGMGDGALGNNCGIITKHVGGVVHRDPEHPECIF